MMTLVPPGRSESAAQALAQANWESLRSPSVRGAYDAEDLEGVIVREMASMGRKVDTATQANSGARIMAQNAVARAERAEVAASKPVVLVVSPANDADIKNDKIKTQ
jgi:hypothetical protein